MPTKPSALFIITSDPRASHRPAEAIRIAAGVGVWKKINVRVYLREAAVLALSEWTDELADGDNYTQYLPILGELGAPIYVQGDAAMPWKNGQPTLPTERISEAQLAKLAAESMCVLRF
jgi:hypothetical protein